MPLRSARPHPVVRLATSIAPALVVLLVGVLAFDGTRRTRGAAERVAHTHEVIEAGRGVLARLVDAETGQRGYLLTGESRYLEPYATAERDVTAQIGRLRELTRDDAAQLARADAIQAVASQKFAELGETIALGRAGPADSVRRLIETDRGKALMDRARRLIGDAESEELRLLAQRRSAQDRYSRITIAVVAVGALLAALLALLTNLTLAQTAAAEARVARRLEDANTQLRAQATELAAATQAAQSASQAKSDFLATIGHELRTPLNAIGGYAELMELEIHGPVTDAQRDDLARIKRSNLHLLSLINDILHFSRVEAKRVEFHLADVPVGSLLGDVEALVAPQLRAKTIGYSHTECGDELVARADPQKLRQILLNLLTNALKFTPAGGRVWLACRADSRTVQIDVSDTGRGIPADQLERVFEPFVQVERHLTVTSQQGVGLGLAISRDLARQMGGEITVASVVGAGSRFTVVLPRA